MITYTPDGRGRFRTAQPASNASSTLFQLGVTNADESDVDFIIHAFDSALPYLASIGSEKQWGTIPFSQKNEVPPAFTAYMQKSYDLNSSSPQDRDWQHLVIYEVQASDGNWTRVAAQGVSTNFPDYVPEKLAPQQVRDPTDYVYLNYLIADRRTGELAKGAGNRLVEFAESQAEAMGKSVFYGDCWRGNNDGLMK